MTDSCPTGDELLAAATDDAGASDVLRHAANCEACRYRVEELRREVAALRSFSRLSMASASANTRAPDERHMPELLEYERIGRYVVVGKLGLGGQAEVYRVIDPELARPLVLKMSKRAAARDESSRRLAAAEGKLLAALDHPGLVRVFDAGVCDDRPYLVLEYVPGRNLEQCYERQRPSPNEAARIMAQAAEVLAYAHRHGVTHGDVTPRNIMQDAEGRIRVIDFGLARLEHVWQDGAGSPGGTPEFLPPELLLADSARRAGPASDVFGLGATLYWLLCGRGPFAAPTVAESLERARGGEIDFSPLRALRAPRRLLQLCVQSLARDPARRSTAAAFAQGLGRTRRPWPGMRSKAALIIVLLAALLLLETAGRLKKNPTVVLSVPNVMVIRDNQEVNLTSVLPLRTDDNCIVNFLVAPGEEVTAVWLNADGRARRLSTKRLKDEEVDVLQYPASPAPMDGPTGTNMIFVCRGKPISEADLQVSFPHQPPPPLPDDVFLQLQRRSIVVPIGHLPPRSSAADAAARASEYMLDIDARLRRHFEGVRGIAFTVRDGSQNSAHD